ncbi:MAG: FAD-dependent oxidoreductase [Bacteroidales bacterium]|jgi:protoporphyrinogen oxidase|nr:FAD-dependent oxidoreductase [Bacteroidales bacterium]
MYDCIVIGGGISGVTFAHRLSKAGKQVLLLEKEDRIGGQISTQTLAGTDFWYETGAHTCYNSYVSLLSVIKEVGQTDSIRQLSKKYPYKLYTQDGFKKIISGLYLPDMLLHVPRALFSDKKGKTVREFYRHILGSRNYDRLFSKAFSAVIVQPADNYPAEMLLKKRHHHCKEQPRTFSFAGGLSAMVSSIAAKAGFPVTMSEMVTGISRNGALYEVQTASGGKWQAASVAVATDARAAADLLQGFESELAALLASIPPSRPETLSVVVPAKLLTIERMAGIIPLNDEFFSAVSRDLTEHPDLRCFTFHFERSTKSDSEKLAIACRTLNIQPSDVTHHSVTTHVLPSLRIRHLNMTAQVANMKKDDNIYLLGNYFKGLSLEDCVQRSLEEAERYLLNRL